MSLLNGSIRAALLTVALLSTNALANEPLSQPKRGLAVEQAHFVLDGKPFRIISGEMHYPRIPREYWHERLKMAKAMGLNAVTAYVFWNVHEAVPGTYDFSGQNDVAEFIREAQKEGLYVILRPGPYVCAEWEWGGYPAWLLKDREMLVRSTDPKFMQPAARWLHRLGQELAPLQRVNGGPIIAVQLENEYGSFDDDRDYLQQMRKILLDSGFGKSLLYTADGPPLVSRGSLPDLPAVITFGAGYTDAKTNFALLKKTRPNGPLMSGEWWDGWFDHWGAPRKLPDAKMLADEFAWILEQGYSISLYMVHGGTSFGWMNGANWDQGRYMADVTSYDYDVPIDESGRPGAKYLPYRDIIAKATGTTPPAIPPTPPTQAIGAFALTESASLWDNLPEPVVSRDLKSMEDLDQAYGYILYRTAVPADMRGDIVIDGVHDYAQIYLNGKYVGKLDRRLSESRLPIKAGHGDTLDILVENTGRINFSRELRGERKGIMNSVALNTTQLHDWKIYSLPMTDTASLHYSSKPCAAAPCFYRTSFKAGVAGSAAADTFLDTTNGWNKGFVWLNGRALGRHWNIGPQRTLYVPGVWLKPNDNQIVILDLIGVDKPQLSALAKPILDQVPPDSTL